VASAVLLKVSEGQMDKKFLICLISYCTFRWSTQQSNLHLFNTSSWWLATLPHWHWLHSRRSLKVIWAKSYSSVYIS